MSETKMSKEEVKIGTPGTGFLGGKIEIPQKILDQAKENKQTLKEINKQKADLDLLVSPEVQEEIAKNIEKIFALGIIVPAAFSLAGCGKPPAIEINQETKGGQETTSPTTVVIETTSPPTTTTPETTTEVVTNAPAIIEDWEFHKDNSTYTNEKGELVAVYLEKAYKQGGEWKSGVGLTNEGLKTVSEENKKKGFPTIVWPFDFKENNNIEIVELVSANEGYKYIGIKYTEPINLYAASDCVLGYKFKYIPQKNDSFSSQDFSGSCFSTGLEVKNRNGEMVSLDYEIEVVDWKPLVTLSQPWLSGRWEIQHFLEEIKIGQLVGQLLPTNPNYSFLDFRNRPDWYENPDHCQASLWINIFGDRLDVKSDLDRILRSGEKDKGITFFVWSNNPKMS